MRIRRSLTRPNGHPHSPLPDDALTPRQREIVELVFAGYENREIAAKLSISYYTVRYHLGSIYAKLGVHTKTGLIRLLLRDPASLIGSRSRVVPR